MRVVLAALAALLLASPAFGEIIYVPDDPPTSFDLGSYSVGADTIIFSRQYYGTTLTPPSAGTEERPIVWIGQGSGVTFASIVPKSHNRFYNLTSTAGVDFPKNGKHIMFDGCTIVGSLNMTDADSSSVRNCIIRGAHFTIARGDLTPSQGSNADADTLDGCTFTGLNASSGFGMVFGDNDSTEFSVGTDSCRYFVQRFNTFNISQSGSAAWTFSKHFQCPNFTSYHNTYNLTSTATGVSSNEGDFGVLFRDNSYNGLMRGDRIFVNNEGATISHYALMWTSGMPASNASNHHFTVDSCYVRVFRGTGLYLQTRLPQLKIANSVVRSRLGTAAGIFAGFESSAGDPYLHHNTFMGKQAIAFSEGGVSNNGGKISNNVFWGTSTLPCDDWQAVAGSRSNVSSLSDSNVAYSTTGNASRAFCRSECAAPGSGQWSTVYGNELHSFWANPDFADTSWANLNVTPKTRFVTNSSAFTLQYAGASNGTGHSSPLGPATDAFRYGSDGYFVQPSDGDRFYVRREDS